MKSNIFNNMREQMKMSDKTLDELYEKISKKKNKTRELKYIRKYTFGIASLAIIIFVSVMLPQTKKIWFVNSFFNSENTNLSVETNEDSSSIESITSEIFIMPQWNDITLVEKFRTIDYNGIEYISSSKDVIDEMAIGKKLSDITTKGYDNSLGEAKEYSINCSLYTLNNISPDCAIAVKFEGEDKYYPYLNGFYVPKTLGDFLNDLNLDENLEFNNSFEYTYIKEDELIIMRYTLPSTTVIWNMLLNDVNVKNTDSETKLGLIDIGLDVITCSINVKTIGKKNISLAVTENGYLTSNILSSATFFIGKESVNSFIDYVINNGTGIVIAKSLINNETNSSEIVTGASVPEVKNE